MAAQKLLANQVQNEDIVKKQFFLIIIDLETEELIVGFQKQGNLRK